VRGKKALRLTAANAKAAVDQAEAERTAREQKRTFRRVQLLNSEINLLVADSNVRYESVSSKATFLAVSTGVVIAAVTSQLWTALPILGVIALSCSSFALFCAAFALRPGKRLGIDAKGLSDRYLDSRLTSGQLEIEVVATKARAVAQREANVLNRARWVWCGFSGLFVAVVALTLVFAFETMG
jgi:hypothetical protein